MESYDEAILKKIRKGGTPLNDRQAIQPLRQHGILSMATWVVGFAEETDRDYRHGPQQLLAYDPDQVQLLYATPHRRTPFSRLETSRRVIQTDTRRWDYKHQVLATRHMPPWRELVWVKFIEAVMQLRPRAFFRLLFMRDPAIRRAHVWYYRVGRRVWPHEVLGFLFRDKRTANGPTLAEFGGEPQDAEEEALQARSSPGRQLVTLELKPMPTVEHRERVTIR